MKAHGARAIMVASALFTTSFVLADPTSDDRLIGRWRHVHEDKVGEIIFNHDGTYSGHVAHKGAMVWEFAGKWSVEGKILSYEYTRSSCENIPAGTRDRDRLLELARDYYLIEAADGARRTYWRVDL